MPYSTTAIDIVMIKDKKHNGLDDTIKIKKDFTTGEFELKYTDENGGAKPITHKAVAMYRQRVLEYVYILLKNHSLDEEGYTDIQVNVPAMPRIIFKAEKLKDLYYREHIYDLLNVGLDLLDNTETVLKKRMLPAVSEDTPVVNDAPEDAEEYIYDYTYKYTYDTPTNTPMPNSNSTTYGVRPQHLFWDE